jgi:hypothetical protein
MVKSLHNTTSFSSGEWSPKVDARVDQAKYSAALRQCLNMMAYKSGGLTRRPGTQLMAPARIQNTPPGNNYAVRVMPFTFSPDTTFNLEFGHKYVRFYSNGQQVMVPFSPNQPNWISGGTYLSGDTVLVLVGITLTPFICILNVSGSVVTPDMDPTHWASPPTVPYEVATPYNGLYNSGSPFTTDVFKIVPCQINDIIYLVHPDFPPYSLSRLGDTDWVMKQVNFLAPALLDQNATDTIITPSELQGTGITLSASAPAWVPENYYNIGNSVTVSGVIYSCIVGNVSSASFAADLNAGYWQFLAVFNPLHVGSTWQLATLRPSAYVEYDGTSAGGFAAGTSDSIQALGQWEVHSYGTWSADIAIQRSLDGGQTWDTIRSVTGRSDRNVDIQGTAGQLGIYRIVVSNVAAPISPGPTNPRIVFECVDAFLYGLVKITAVPTVSAPAFVNGQVYEIASLGTTNWFNIGAGVNYHVGTIFTYNGTPDAGTGTAFQPYVATADVVTQLTDSNPQQPQWVSGQAYTAGQQSSYQFVNYTALNNVTSATPPSQDTTNWAPTAPGGTEYWSEAAWSNYRGFPQAIASFQQRVIYASSGFEPQRIWGTVTNDIENFALGDQTLATDAFAFDLNAPGRGPIVWLVSQTDLFAGFSGAEWVISSGSASSSGGTSGASITPTQINAVEHGTFGSAPFVQPAVIGNAVIFTQRQADAIRQMLFSIETTKYMSSDLTTLADHLFPSGIVQLGYQQRWRHQGIIWVVTQQGSLCGLTYDLDQQVYGWHRHLTGNGAVDINGIAIPNDNGFESVSVIDGQGTNDDEVWLVANRLIGGVQTRFIERINPNNWEETFTGAPNPAAPSLPDAFYVDCGSTVLNPGSTTITGLSALNGRYVIGLADGYNFGPLLVEGGQVTLPPSIPGTVAKVQIGLPIAYAGQPMRFDADPRVGNTQGIIKQISDIYLRLWNSMGGMVSNGTATYPTWVSGASYLPGNNVISPLTQQAYQCVVTTSSATDPSQLPANWQQTALPSYQPPVPINYTGSTTNPFAQPTLITKPTDIRIQPKGMPSPSEDPVIVVQGSDALPLTVLAVVLKYDVTAVP